MTIFKYRAKEGPNTVEGTVEASTKEEAVEKVHQLGLVPVRVEPLAAKEAVTGAKPPPASRPLPAVGARLKSKTVTLFTWQLSCLLHSGISITRGLQILSQQSSDANLKRILENIEEVIKQGQTFSGALSNHARAFSPFYIAMIKSGEDSGTLEEVLAKLAEYSQKRDELFSKVRTALAYPVLMIFVGIGTIYFMFSFAMPRVMNIFLSTEQELPVITKILVAISNTLQHAWPVIVILIVLVIVSLKQGRKSPAQRLVFDRIQLGIPVFGEFIRKSELAKLCQTMNLLIKSGIPILQAIEVAAPVLNNEAIRAEFLKTIQDLKAGGSFGKSLGKSKIFPGFMTNLILIGEESGRLGETLGEIASAFTRDTEEATKVMTALLEPIIILVMGLIVGFIVIGMLLPIFQLNFAVQ